MGPCPRDGSSWTNLFFFSEKTDLEYRRSGNTHVGPMSPLGHWRGGGERQGKGITMTLLLCPVVGKKQVLSGYKSTHINILDMKCEQLSTANHLLLLNTMRVSPQKSIQCRFGLSFPKTTIPASSFCRIKKKKKKNSMGRSFSFQGKFWIQKHCPSLKPAQTSILQTWIVQQVVVCLLSSGLIKSYKVKRLSFHGYSAEP